MKKGPAIIASLVTGLFLVFGVAAMALNALVAAQFPKAVVSTQAPAAVESSAALQPQIAQLEARITEYQAREAVLQDQISQLNQQLAETSGALNGYQNLISALQENGVIRIDASGRVHVTQDNADRDHDD